MLLFTLTMPNVGSWNGKWSGDGKLYCRSRKLSKDLETALDDKSFFYRWDDGWTACVSVKKLPATEARKFTKKTLGFAGYDWMIDSIIKKGEISNV